MKKLQEKLNNLSASNKFVQTVSNFLLSKYFIPVFALYIFICQALGLDILGFAGCVLVLAFTLLFSQNARNVLTVLAFATFCVSVQNSPQSMASGYQITGIGSYVIGEASTFYTSVGFFVFVGIALSVLIFPIIYRVSVADFKRVFSLKGIGIGLVVMAIGFLGSGLFSPSFEMADVVLSITQGGCFIAIYLLFACCIDPKDLTLDFVAQVMTWVLIFVCALIGYLYATRFAGVMSLSVEWKNLLLAGGAISNDLGTYIAFCMPALFYNIYKNPKNSVFNYVVACVAMVAIYFTLARGSMIVAVVEFVFCTGALIVLGKGRKTAIIGFASALAFVGVFVLALYLSGNVENFFTFFISKGQNGSTVDSGRFTRWARFIDYFKDNLIFGAGWTADKEVLISEGLAPGNGIFDSFSYFAHNNVFQILGGSGLFGILTYAFHRFTTVKVFLKKFTVKRAIFAIAIFGFVAMSFLDIVFFKAYYQFLYIAILMACEYDLQNELAIQKETKNDQLQQDVKTETVN